MLLSIDRVLQLISEGKDINKIAELAGCETEQVVALVLEGRKLLNEHNRQKARKKIRLVKTKNRDMRDSGIDENRRMNRLFEGAELTAIPVESTLVIYAAGMTRGPEGPCGIGLVIHDANNVQVGKIAAVAGALPDEAVQLTAVLRAVSIAQYFDTKNLKIRVIDDRLVKKLNGEIESKTARGKILLKQIRESVDKMPHVTFETVPPHLNEKAIFLAESVLLKKQGNPLL